MKKLILALALLPVIGANAQTVKKVMLEDYTGSWCQYCPNGSKGIETIEGTNPSNFIPVASHNDGGYGWQYDSLMIAEGRDVATGVGVTGYPTGAVDRKLITGGKIPIGINSNADQWKSAVTTRAAIAAPASVSFANLKKNTDGTYEGDVVVKFVTAPTAGVPITVNVYVLENKIEARKYPPSSINLEQANITTWYGGNGSTKIYTTTASGGYYHNHTLRAALGGTWGWSGVVPATVVVGTEYKKHFTITIPANAPAGAWKPANMEVVGFVAYNGTAAADQKEIMNAERVTMAAFFPANVETVKNNVAFLQAYPNPATANDVVNMEYTIANSEKVTLNVYNAIGQLVATPYVSEDVRGTHSIIWRPADNALSAGVYILQLSTNSGKATQRLTIQ